MKIEVLFPELCNLFGDSSNIKYLSKCLPDAEFIKTSLNDDLKFLNDDIALVYMGPMSESAQEKVINKLKEYKAQIIEKIEQNQIFLFTGNAVEVLYNYIENEDGSKVDGLGIFDLYAKRDMWHRYNGLVLGKYQDIEIVGFQTQFTKTYGDVEKYPFLNLERGMGMNKEHKVEGVCKNNFYGTYVIGPILVLNPYFTEFLLKKMGVENPQIAFKEAVVDAYNQRLKEFKDSAVKID